MDTEYPEIREIPRIFIFELRDREFTPSVHDVSIQRQASFKQSIQRWGTFTKEHEVELADYIDKNVDSRSSQDDQDSDTGSDGVHAQNHRLERATVHNRDYRLAQIHAADGGYLAKKRHKAGSYLIQMFADGVRQNIEEGQDKNLGQIMEGVRDAMYDEGHLAPRNAFNDDTRTLRIKMNR